MLEFSKFPAVGHNNMVDVYTCEAACILLGGGGDLKEVLFLECDGKSYRKFISFLEKMQHFTIRQIFVHGLGRDVCMYDLFQSINPAVVYKG
jgi:hypothetical protein